MKYKINKKQDLIPKIKTKELKKPNLLHVKNLT